MLKKQRVTLTVFILLAFMALMTGIFVSRHLHTPVALEPDSLHGTLLSAPRAIQPFRLTGIDHKTFDNIKLQGEWTMFFFGFTSCGYLCPTTLAELGKMFRLLEEKKVAPLPRVVMITVDPQRDSLEKLGQYVTAFDPHFYGARGDEENIASMTKELGIAYMKVARTPEGEPQEEDYDIDHSGTVMLFNPQGMLTAFFTTPHRSEWLADDYIKLISTAR